MLCNRSILANLPNFFFFFFLGGGGGLMGVCSKEGAYERDYGNDMGVFSFT